LLQADPHGDRRNEKTLGQRPADPVERIVIGLGAVEIAYLPFEARDLDKGVADGVTRLKNALLTIREYFVPYGED
jgi:hypothetical protein